MEARSVCLEIVLILTQDRSTVCVEHMMELLGDVGHLESQICPIRDGVKDCVRWVHGLRQTYHTLRNHFDTPDSTPS
jgi:hypothetical protein